MSDDESEASDIGTENTMRERANESRLKLWVLLRANRFEIMMSLAGCVFVAFILVSVVLPPSLEAAITSADTVETVFSSMIGVVVTGTTLVVSINQLVLSQETGPLGDQRKRMSDAMDFRTYTTQLLGEVTPADPSAFLRELVRVSEKRAAALERLMMEHDDDDLRSEVEEFADSVRGNADTVRDQLEGAQFGTFDVLFAALNYNYSWKIYQLERLSENYGDELTDDQKTAVEELRTALAMFGPAREHIKTLYFQWALVDLSRYILYVAVPALIVAGCTLTFVGAESFPGTTWGVDNITWVVSGAFTLTVMPFLLFTSYIFRIATVAKRTLAIGPLILRESQR
jgi:hypothetical protein